MILFHTVLSIAILAGFFDGVEREFARVTEQERRDDLVRRGFII